MWQKKSPMPLVNYISRLDLYISSLKMYISSLEIYKSNVKIWLFSGIGKFFSKKHHLF